MPSYVQIEQIFNQHYAALVLYANRFVSDQQQAEDVVQSVFVTLLEKGKKLHIQNEKAYLFRSVKHACLAHLKQQQLAPPTAEVEPLYFEDPIEAAEFEAYVYTLIQNLPPATQRIFKMNRFDGMNNQQIADTLNISKRTVELQISNALKALRQGLQQSNHTPQRFLNLLMLW